MLLYFLIVASPDSTKPATATLNAAAAATTTTAESAKEAPTPNIGNHDNNDLVDSQRSTKVLSSLVAYGDDSDSDIDT